jgi:hypothetical protein
MDDEDCEIIKLWSVNEVEDFLKSKGFTENVTAILKGKSLSIKNKITYPNSSLLN